MALIGAAFGIGFTFGPLLCYTSFFVPSKAAPGAAAALLSLVALVLAIVLLPETLRTGAAGGPAALAASSALPSKRCGCRWSAR